ncbi:MAG: hypothetical protein WKG01_21385, partial [Kofleriaceae bacterium]
PPHQAPPHQAPPHQAPPHGPPGHPPHHIQPPHGAQRARSKTGLYLGLGIGALAVAGGIVAVVMLTGKDKAGGGEASREGVVRMTFAALARGDVDALMKLTGAETRDRFIKCKGPTDETPKRDLDKLRVPIKKAADATKGVKLEVVEIGTDDDPTVSEKGTTFGDENFKCTQLAKSVEHRFDVRFKATQPERKEVEQEIRVSVVSIDGSWYLSEVPELKLAGSCETAVAHAVDKTLEQMLRTNTLGADQVKAVLADIRTIGIKHCNEDSWDDSVLDCLGETTDAESMDVCMKQLSTTQREKFENETSEAFKKHQPKVVPPPDVPPEPPKTALGPNCQAYKRTIETIQCAEITEEARKALLDTFDELVKLAAGPTGDPEQGCEVAITTLKQMCQP